MLLITLAIILVIFGALTWAMTVTLMARRLLRPPRMTDGKAAYVLQRLSPGDLQLPFEELHFDVRDERTGRKIRLTAWWIPAHEHAARRDGCAILIHGYADAKVGAIAWAPLFHSLGLNILAIDLRAHGESEGDQTTAGFFERHDLNQVIDQLRAARPNATRRVWLFGVSLGAAVALATAALRGGGNDDDLAGVILNSPYVAFPSAARAHARLMGFPGPAFQAPAIRLAEWLGGANFSAVRPVDLIESGVRCPLLIIQEADDPFLSEGDDQRIAAAVARRPASFGPSLCWTVPNAGHVLALAAAPDAYRQTVADFIAQTSRSSTAQAAAPAQAPRSYGPNL